MNSLGSTHADRVPVPSAGEPGEDTVVSRERPRVKGLWSALLPGRGPVGEVSEELARDIDRAFQIDRQDAQATAAAFRFVSALAFLLFTLVVFRLTGKADWSSYLPPLVLYSIVSAVVFALRRQSFANSLTVVAALMDVWLIGTVQLQTMPLSPFPAGVAGFSLGIFALLVGLNALTFRSSIIYLTAGAGAVVECVLIRAAHVSTPPMIAAVLVLVIEARALQMLTHRLQTFLVSLAGAEAERQFERRKVAEIEASRQTIESLLVASREQNEQLVRLQQDKERLSQVLVHDLRSPLSVVIASIDIAQMQLSDCPAEVKADLDAARASSFRLAAMINGILDIAKLEDGALPIQREPVDMCELVETIARETAPLRLAKHLNLELASAPPLGVEVDRSLLTRVIENLAANATRYTPPGGAMRLAAAREGDIVSIRGQNPGQPLGETLRSRLFAKYQQEEPGRGGWGLGLYFCRLVLEAHGGTIAVEDAPDWSVSMVIRLPAASKISSGV